MKYSIVPLEHSALHRKARRITPDEIGGDYLSSLIKRMKEILTKEELGVAIAAPQVGEAVQLFIVSGKVFDAREKNNKTEEESDAKKPPSEDRVYINPKILKYSQKKIDMHEGCLTLPGLWGMVPRSERVRMSFLNEKGEESSYGASGLLAHTFQHEVDHLDGIIYTAKAHDVYEESAENSETKHE